ncbi:CvpA family protein [Gracilinema caldarium]|uniref:Colicin V production protein n=1 Tax=Gracilinema caldarium (strain ATCC 51460 / DSM 7334 / H1) TaxID=744872 RepID=F8EZ64_GRAC1|nr:CvpA family protein [Gracilinema caldarium]AEJ19656.1 Colicin V production protein [Gracilinema caldarium DSM 7334]
MNIATIDIIFGALLILFVLRCTLRGFVEEFMSVASVVLGLIVGFLLFKNGAVLLRTEFGLTLFPELTAFIVLFLITFLVIKLLEAMIKDLVERINLDSLDHIAGFMLGLVEGVLIISIILLVLVYQPLFNAIVLLEKSWFYHILLPLIGELQRNSPVKLGA